MPRHWPLFNVIAWALLSVPAAAQQPGIQWQQDIESAKTQAKQTGRLVLVHFWTPNCGPCLALEQNVFNQPSVGGAIEARFVPVKLNANENSAAALGFGINRVPMDVILSPDGQEVYKQVSPPTPAGYVQELSQVAVQYATRARQLNVQGAANVPAPAQVNAAYAGLQVAPNTVPAASAPMGSSVPDRYAMPPAGNLTGTAGVSPESVGGAVASTNGHIPWNGQTALAGPATPAPNNTYATAPPPATSSATAALRYNPYGHANPQSPAPSNGASAVPQNGLAPTQMTNSYAVTAPAGRMATATSAVAPTVGAAQNAVVAAVAPQSAPPRPPDARALPPGAAPLGFDGYCPVSMRTKWTWVSGDPKWGVMHRGRTYWFVGAGEQQQFLTDPDRYSPALSGMDPVLAFDHRQQVPGKREHSIDYDNIFYMFSSEATLQQFAANPDRYAASARQAMGIPRGRLVR
jgi:YHS domain-containing protein/thiol-disulfide isomerase/thioredoxin